MTTILLVVALSAFIVLFVLPRPGQRDFGGLSEQQLQRYIAYAATPLADGGWIYIQRSGTSARIGIKKRDLERRATLTVPVSSGEHPREAVQSVADRLKGAGIEHRLTLTRRKRLPRWAEVKLRADDPLTPSACTHIVDQMSMALGASGDTYDICLAGRYRHGFPPEDGEVIPHTRAHRYGYTLGYWIGSIYRALRTRE